MKLSFILYTPLLCQTVTKDIQILPPLTLTKLNLCDYENINKTDNINVTYEGRTESHEQQLFVK